MTDAIATKISKHLMLLFNLHLTKRRRTQSTFQNISCYCLTSPSTHRNYPQIYFKTSHVIV